jgi:hypothetical protein
MKLSAYGAVLVAQINGVNFLDAKSRVNLPLIAAFTEAVTKDDAPDVARALRSALKTGDGPVNSVTNAAVKNAYAAVEVMYQKVNEFAESPDGEAKVDGRAIADAIAKMAPK